MVVGLLGWAPQVVIAVVVVSSSVWVWVTPTSRPQLGSCFKFLLRESDRRRSLVGLEWIAEWYLRVDSTVCILIVMFDEVEGLLSLLILFLGRLRLQISELCFDIVQ